LDKQLAQVIDGVDVGNWVMDVYDEHDENQTKPPSIDAQ